MVISLILLSINYRVYIGKKTRYLFSILLGNGCGYSDSDATFAIIGKTHEQLCSSFRKPNWEE